MLRSCVAIVLALMLALTGQGIAGMRGATDASGQMVICTGTGPVTIYVDDQGNPTGAPHFCPDCALHLMVDIVLPDTTVQAVAIETRLHPVRAGLQCPARSAPSPIARGPPVTV